MATEAEQRGPEYETAAAAALHAALRHEHDFADWLARMLATVSAMNGGSYALIAGRPGSWEADHVITLVRGTVGHDDEHLNDYLPAGFTPPVTSAALYTAAQDGRLYLASSIWLDGLDGDTYLRQTPLRRGENLDTDLQQWLRHGTPPAAGDWRKLDPDQASQIRGQLGMDLDFVARAHADHSVDVGDNLDAYPDLVRYYIDDYGIEQEEAAAEDATWPRLEELAGIAQWPGTVQRTATVSGEAPGAAVWSPDLDDPAEVEACYRQAMLATLGDDATRARVTEIKTSYDAWYGRWRGDPQRDHGVGHEL
jgi:hypothetical protein